MSLAKEFIELNEGLRTEELYQIFKKVEAPSWNSFLSSLQSAIDEVSGKTITTEHLKKAFKRLM
jgi:hypothetical protein